MPEKLFLIDGMSMVYRAYFALIATPLINSKGKNTAAVFGFLNSLIKILDDEKPHHIAVCFDTDKPTFRHTEYDQYKATRSEIPSDMPWQIGMVKEIVKAFNIPLIEVDGYEADDVIGTLVKQAEIEKVSSYMVTPDKDFMQLVNDCIFLYRPARNIYGNKVSDVEIIDIEGVHKKFGVEPSQVIDVLGLMGDTVDNVPGVKGVGEKTATSLIQQFGSIEQMYERIDEITKPKLKENLLNNKEMALLSKKLVTIKCDVPLDINFHSLVRQETDKALLQPLLEELEFKTLLKKLIPEAVTNKLDTPASSKAAEQKITAGFSNIKVSIPYEQKPVKTIKEIPHKYICVKTNEEFIKLLDRMSKEEIISFNTKTDSQDCMYCNLVGFSFSAAEHEAFYVPVYGEIKQDKLSAKSLFEQEEAVENTKSSSGVEINFALEKLKVFFANRNMNIIGQNLKYDYIVLRNYGIEMDSISFDALVAGYLLSPESNHELNALSVKYLNYDPVSISELIGTGKAQITMDKVEIPRISDYASEDADIALQLYHKLKFELEKIGLYKLALEIEFPLIKVLAEMEFEGIKVDEKILKQIDTLIVTEAGKLETKIYGFAGEKFNINSTKQLADILFNKLKLTPARKTKTGFSTDVKVLEDLKSQHEIAEHLVDYRMLTKLKSTYTEGLTKAINPKTKRVHTSFNQLIAATGRLSSVNPNLQNIPIRTDVGRSIRKAFVPKSDEYLILSADYSQIELRIMAHYADDENMISAFKKNLDIHSATAMRVFDVKTKADVTPAMRRKAKEVNFGIIYGIGAFGLASRLEIRNSEAKEIIERYFAQYPKVREYMDRTKKFAREYGYVETLMGRRRYLKQINNQNASARAEDERAAINMPIQGTAADMIKIAMINIYNDLCKKKMKTKMLLQVHDELVFEVHKDELEEVTKLVESKMRTAIKLKAPIQVEVGHGKSWYDAH